MLTAGVDLAAEPKGSALAVLEWNSSDAHLTQLMVGVDDAAIVEVAPQVSKLGIDCALGWPIDFVDFLVEHSSGKTSSTVDGGMDWRRRLSYRETDRVVREITGRWPLSVSTDRLGVTALRCAGLLSRLAESGMNVDRSGAGLIVEVYPSASLRLWGLDISGYKNSPEVRARLIQDLQNTAPWLKLGSYEATLTDSCDAFDALITALLSRAAVVGCSYEPPQHLMKQAQVEGWIALPQVPLDDLLHPPHTAL